jgi:hypothetical protein
MEVIWDEYKRREWELADAIPNATAVDFMLPSPITLGDANYWVSIIGPM